MVADCADHLAEYLFLARAIHYGLHVLRYKPRDPIAEASREFVSDGWLSCALD